MLTIPPGRPPAIYSVNIVNMHQLSTKKPSGSCPLGFCVFLAASGRLEKNLSIGSLYFPVFFRYIFCTSENYHYVPNEPVRGTHADEIHHASNGELFFSYVQTFRAIQEAFINSGLLGCQDLTSCEFKRTQRRRRRLRV